MSDEDPQDLDQADVDQAAWAHEEEILQRFREEQAQFNNDSNEWFLRHGGYPRKDTHWDQYLPVRK